MASQHSDDFKLYAIKLYLKLNSVRKVAEILNCSKTSLHRWITRYFEIGNDDRKEYSKRKGNLTDKIAKYIVSLIKEKPTITLAKIKKKILKEHKYDISLSYLFYIVKYKLNLTHKQLRK
jgi:transposase